LDIYALRFIQSKDIEEQSFCELVVKVFFIGDLTVLYRVRTNRKDAWLCDGERKGMGMNGRKGRK